MSVKIRCDREGWVTAVEFRGQWIEVPHRIMWIDKDRETIHILIEAIDDQYPRQ